MRAGARKPVLPEYDPLQARAADATSVEYLKVWDVVEAQTKGNKSISEAEKEVLAQAILADPKLEGLDVNNMGSEQFLLQLENTIGNAHEQYRVRAGAKPSHLKTTGALRNTTTVQNRTPVATPQQAWITQTLKKAAAIAPVSNEEKRKTVVEGMVQDLTRGRQDISGEEKKFLVQQILRDESFNDLNASNKDTKRIPLNQKISDLHDKYYVYQAAKRAETHAKAIGADDDKIMLAGDEARKRAREEIARTKTAMMVVQERTKGIKTVTEAEKKVLTQAILDDEAFKGLNASNRGQYQEKLNKKITDTHDAYYLQNAMDVAGQQADTARKPREYEGTHDQYIRQAKMEAFHKAQTKMQEVKAENKLKRANKRHGLGQRLKNATSTLGQRIAAIVTRRPTRVQGTHIAPPEGGVEMTGRKVGKKEERNRQ